MSQRALRHVCVARTRLTHCIRYSRSFSAQAVARQLPQETESEDPSHVASNSSTEASTSRTEQLVNHATSSTFLTPRTLVPRTQPPQEGQQDTAPSDVKKRQFLRTEAYLMKLNSEGLEPTIADLERFKAEKPLRSNTPQYVEQHNTIVDSICRAFSREQLREFLEIYEVSFRRKASKVRMAEAIVEKAWGWPSLAEIEKSKRERTEVAGRCQLVISYFASFVTEL